MFLLLKLIAKHFNLYIVVYAANYYPTAWTLFPSAVIMGIAGGPFWATARIYVARLARVHATHTMKDFSKISGLYFGIFYMLQVNVFFVCFLIIMFFM